MTVRYLGIDIGGTNCKLAVLEAAGDRPALLATATVPTGSGDPGEVVDRLATAAARLAAEHGPVVAAGAGVPGLFDQQSGRIVLLPNLPPAWTGHQFRKPLAERLGVPTVLINDARSFTLAESRMGAAAGCSTVICLTLGTGVGGAWWSTAACASAPTAGLVRSATRSSTRTGHGADAATVVVSRRL